MKKLKSIYVTGIVKDSKNNMEKYLFSENERLNAIIDELEDLNEDYLTENFLLNVKINKAIEYIKSDDFWLSQRKAEKELLTILGDKENGRNDKTS